MGEHNRGASWNEELHRTKIARSKKPRDFAEKKKRSGEMIQFVSSDRNVRLEAIQQVDRPCRSCSFRAAEHSNDCCRKRVRQKNVTSFHNESCPRDGERKSGGPLAGGSLAAIDTSRLLSRNGGFVSWARFRANQTQMRRTHGTNLQQIRNLFPTLIGLASQPDSGGLLM